MERNNKENDEIIMVAKETMKLKDEHVLFKENYEEFLLKDIKDLENNLEHDEKIFV